MMNLTGPADVMMVESQPVASDVKVPESHAEDELKQSYDDGAAQRHQQPHLPTPKSVFERLKDALPGRTAN